MIQRASAPTATPEANGLAQQKTDFTSEGSPPPGHVATTPPATAHKTESPVPHAKAPAVRGNKHVPWGKSR